MSKFKVGKHVAYKTKYSAYTGEIIGYKKRLFTTEYIISRDGRDGVECVKEKDVFNIV